MVSAGTNASSQNLGYLLEDNYNQDYSLVYYGGLPISANYQNSNALQSFQFRFRLQITLCVIINMVASSYTLLLLVILMQ